MKIGIIGAESKHVEYFSIPINKEKRFGNAHIHCIWGGDTTADRLRTCSSLAEIEGIAKTPSEVIDASEAIIITLRDGNLHSRYALECIQKRKPVFIDKPFTVNPTEALNILKAAQDYKTPFTGGSTLCFLPEIPMLQEQFKTSAYAEISYRADPLSPHGGWYFYGSHLTDLCATICGEGAVAVKANVSGDKVIADIYYEASNDPENSIKNTKKKVQINSAPDLPQPMVKMEDIHILNDNTCYNYGLKAFFDVIRTGTSPDANRLLYSVKLMDAIMRSASTKDTVRIEG